MELLAANPSTHQPPSRQPRPHPRCGDRRRWRRSQGRPPAAMSQDIDAPKIPGYSNDFMLVQVRCATNFRQHIQDFRQTVVQPKQATNQLKEIWQRTPADFVKVNFDVAFYADTGQGAWGCVFRSDQGYFLTARQIYAAHLGTSACRDDDRFEGSRSE
ncbi:uncharacterized protein LOC125513474 [Triticum urartu]|uniref:uncharacterized protein LOC125513474 n=1 Tax=Triticum urartu TaxID=4572 RepID=UPI0020440C48|nr:uncharacterized protein LOC125513474 [Triticum urartu]